MAAPKKNFALGGFLKEKPAADIHAGTEESVAAALASEVADGHEQLPSQLGSASSVALREQLVSKDSARLDAPILQAPAVISTHSTDGHPRKKPGPKGRGLYEKRTIGIAKDLDDFVEHARRSHVRPDGTPTTVYSHFIEDLIAAERQRRATR